MRAHEVSQWGGTAVRGGAAQPRGARGGRAAWLSNVLPARRVTPWLGCSDSRLTGQIVFDHGLVDLFVVRTGGHVMGPEVLGSIEYGVDVLDCQLVLESRQSGHAR